MHYQISPCADLLDFGRDLTGRNRVIAQLGWVADLCGASTAALALRDGMGALRVCVGWLGLSSVSQGDGLTAIGLGLLDGADAVLLLSDVVLSDAVTAQLRELKSALCLIFDLHLARTPPDEEAGRFIPVLASPVFSVVSVPGSGFDVPCALDADDFIHPVKKRQNSGTHGHGPSGAFPDHSGVTTEQGQPGSKDLNSVLAPERLSAILRVLPELVFEMTTEGRYTDFFAAPLDLIGDAWITLPGLLLEDVLPPKIATAARSDLVLTLRTGRSPPARYQLASPLGLRWYERTGIRKDGLHPTVIFVVRDVTEEMQQDEDLLRLGRIVENMSNLVVVVDLNRRITWANRAWEVRTGWGLSEVRGRVLGSLVRGTDGDEGSAALVATAMEHGEAYHGETINIDAGGNRYCVDFNILPLYDADGHITGYVSVETDITAQKANEVYTARLAAEAESMRSRLFNAIETLPDGVIIWDQDERMVVANSAYRRMYPEVAAALVEGVSQDEIFRIGLAAKTFPCAVGREEEWLAEQRHRYRNPTIDEVYRSDGHWIRRLDLRTSDGGRIAVRIDTTERHRQIDALDNANRSLAEARQSLAQIIESANVGTWDWRADQGIQIVNDRYATMLGYGPEELGQTWNSSFRDLVHPEDLARLNASEDDDFARIPNGDEPVREHQLRMRRKDGSWAWILSRSAVTERSAGGRHKRVVGIHLDVTEPKELADEVATSRAFLNEVMDASIAAIVVINVAGVITYANAEAERVLGVPSSKIAGRRFDDPAWSISAPDGTPLMPENTPFHRALADRAVVRDLQMAIAWPDGTRRILSVNAVPHIGTNVDGGPSLVITSFVDITADLAKTDRLEQALEQAQAANRSKSTFLANMSHEIRTPLNGVLGMAELLEERITDPGKKQMIGTIRQSGELLLNVLNDILDMSKIEAGKLDIEQIPFVPGEIVRQLERLHGPRATEKGLELTVFTNPGAECVRLGDPFRIQQIINNLLSNAIKFTQTGWIAITVAAPDDKCLTIKVHDTGIGMTAEQTSRIFDNFEQAEAGTTRRYGGTGLGMTIVRSLTTLMGGNVAVNSTLGRGTVVEITLPSMEDFKIQTSGALPPEDAEDMDLAGVRLLVADDSATNRLVLRAMLQGSGATIEMTTNGVEAVAEWQRLLEAGTPVDLLLLDISMPELDGVGALAAIRAMGGLGQVVPAVALTANAMSHQIAEYFAAGFDLHVSKPFRKAELLIALSTIRQRKSSGMVEGFDWRRSVLQIL